MRTTLSIDDDVLAAAKEIARTDRKSLGRVISALARAALRPTPSRHRLRNGVPLLPARPGAKRVPLQMVVNCRNNETPDLPQQVRKLPEAVEHKCGNGFDGERRLNPTHTSGFARR